MLLYLRCFTPLFINLFFNDVIRYGSKDGKAKGSWRAGLTKLALNSLRSNKQETHLRYTKILEKVEKINDRKSKALRE